MIIKERNSFNGNVSLLRDEFYYWRKKRNISIRKKRISRKISKDVQLYRERKM
jgi:hypothetical protein